jgi:hypothetical protein
MLALLKEATSADWVSIVNMREKPTLTAYEIFVIKALTGSQGGVLVSP